MRLLLIYLLIASAGCVPKQDEQEDTRLLQPALQQAVAITGLPAPVREYIATHLRGWAIVNKEDYDSSFWSFYDSAMLPFFTATDLNDDGLVDYGVLVKKEGFVQLAFLLGAGDSFTHQLANDFKKAFNDTTNDLTWCLTPAPPGQTDVAYPRMQSLILRSNGINLLQLENRTCIYYWDGQGIGLFATPSSGQHGINQ